MAPKKRQRIADLANLSKSVASNSFNEFVNEKLKNGDTGALKLVRAFVAKKETCVFSGDAFVAVKPGRCKVQHDVEEWEPDEHVPGPGGWKMMYRGRCSYCCEDVHAIGNKCEAPYAKDVGTCYSGPHVSEFPDGYGDDDGSEDS